MSMKKWRSCNKCSGMFFDGRGHKGTCPAGSGHVAQGLEFNLPHGGADNGHAQGAWRFCNRCFGMFFDGFERKGTCPAGGAHQPDRKFNFVLPHDVQESFPQTQTNWRFCSNCFGMFFDGSTAKGRCPAGGVHVAQGFVFVLPTTNVVLDDG